MKAFRIATNLILGLGLLCLLPAVVQQFSRSAVSFATDTDWRPFAAGLVPGAIMGRAALRWAPRLCVLEHELTHAFVGLFFGYIPVGIKVERHRGLCTQRNLLPWLVPVSRPVVALAPYFLPTVTAVMALFRPLVAPAAQPWYDFGIGATFTFHAVTTYREILENGAVREATVSDRRSGLLTDFHEAGPVFSWLFILVATVVAHGLIMSVISRGYGGLSDDLRRIVADTASLGRYWS